MTAQEFSSEFDLLYNNVSSNQAPGLTEYEKSVFLTKAQDEIIKNYFTDVQGGNKYQQGVEDSNKRYSDFSCLITVDTIDYKEAESATSYDERGKIFDLADLEKPLMITITESFSTAKDGDAEKMDAVYQVIPVKFEEYQRLMSKPSGDPLKRQVWKLMGNSTSGNGSIEIIPHWREAGNKTNKLTIRYVRRPYPIILEDISSQKLSINHYQVPLGLSDNSIFRVEKILARNHYGNEDDIYGIRKYIGNSATWVNDLTGNLYTTTDTETAQDFINDHLLEDNTLSDVECCELSEELHPEILQRAVELAKAFYVGEIQAVTTVGQRSE